MTKLSKITTLVLLTCSLNAGEIELGKGTFKIDGGFIGVTKTIEADLQTYSMIEQHSSLFGSQTWFYKYNFTWYDSKEMVSTQDTINTTSSQYFPSAPTSMVTPTIDYRLQGLDINLGIGKDINHKDENNYLGVALVTGLSIPWIDSKKDSNNDDTTSDSNMTIMKSSKTKIYTYKLGLSTTGRVSLNNYFTLYGSGTYAYQTGTIKNDYAKADLTVNGIFQEYDVGIRFQPVSYDKKIGWITFSPRLYATLGYRYTNWELKDINVDVTGLGVNFAKTDFTMNSSVTYFGIGYSF